VAYQTVPEEFIYPVTRKILIATAIFALIVPATIADNFPASGPVVSGKVARLHSGQAAAPKKAPVPVKRAIWAANQLRSKPYRYGGGHKSFDDRGYDCSGTVSYVLAGAGLISSPMSSTEFRSYGDRGQGEWITIYAREGHTFAVIAGLRLDTTPYDRYRGNGRRAGRRFIVHRAGSTRDIQSACSEINGEHLRFRAEEDKHDPRAPSRCH